VSIKVLWHVGQGHVIPFSARSVRPSVEKKYTRATTTPSTTNAITIGVVALREHEQFLIRDFLVALDADLQWPVKRLVIR
jgi:hypothetical protein